MSVHEKGETVLQRESFKSRLGFILVSAGCAIGIGNVWKFPFVAGKNGGGLFVLIYLMFLAAMGIPILVLELSLGRASRKSMVKAYKKLEPKGSKWHLHGWVCLGGSYLLMMFYTTVAGWMLNYACKFAFGRFEGVTTEQSDSVFADMLSNPPEMLLFMGICVLLGFLVCAGGVKNGLEKISKWMMLALLSLIILLAGNSLFLDGAAEGLRFYLMPNFKSLETVGLLRILSAAMSQAFFTLSVGIGSMEIFGSYMSKDNTLVSEAIHITALDTFVAIMSGLIIFPACFSYNVAPSEGPSLIFSALPKIFINMPFGRIWGSMFFLFMSFAAFSTLTAVFENLISSCMDNFEISRKKATLINCAVILIGSLPCLFGFNLLSGVSLFGKNILEIEDYIVSNLLLPVGSLLFLFFCTNKKLGWGFDNFLAEANTGKGVKVKRGLRYYFRFVLPLLVLLVFIAGVVPQE